MDEMFPDGDPWDILVNVTATLERLIIAHNDLADETQKLRKKVAILSARVEELKAIAINEGYSLDRPKRP